MFKHKNESIDSDALTHLNHLETMVLQAWEFGTMPEARKLRYIQAYAKALKNRFPNKDLHAKVDEWLKKAEIGPFETIYEAQQ